MVYTLERGTFQTPAYAFVMLSFPLIRTSPVIPFMNIGVDCFGPFKIRLLEGEIKRVYGLIFACLVTRAVHLELLYDMSAEVSGKFIS